MSAAAAAAGSGAVTAPAAGIVTRANAVRETRRMAAPVATILRDDVVTDRDHDAAAGGRPRPTRVFVLQVIVDLLRGRRPA
ncbi:hypothetical protein CAE01nite_27750 [Cellulomonas aerilata]|uniref:Uncharacterized protein n=1 Tax=Cellulomonas aerilata TaxID=515326 RepID=A0A512DFR4_9CELL|nr:hypothetical protein CAE01nite_27750 [Cellulomonas aerilata]